MENPNFKIDFDGNIQISGHINYNDIVEILTFIKINRIKRFKKINDLIKHKDIIEKYLPIIQNNKEPVLEILTRASDDRYVIYKLCDILSLRYERIEIHKTRTFECCEFDGPYTEENGCGCGNVPKKFKKYEADLDYDDQYMLYEVPWTYKMGVRILF